MNPAPRQEPTPLEEKRRDDLLDDIRLDTGTSRRTASRPLRGTLLRRVAFTGVGALAAGAAVVALTGGLPLSGDAGTFSSAQLASWTPQADRLASATPEGRAAEAICRESTGAGEQGKISHTDQRGDIASMIVTVPDDAYYCLATGDTGLSMVVGPPTEPAATEINLSTLGSRGSGGLRVNYALGAVGDDVTGVTLHEAGSDIVASVLDGRWSAWWPKGNPDGTLTGEVTLHYADGHTRQVAPDSVAFE
ncbi:hypothetical protein [Streptomyces sp. AC627_RSS907]|uniref:hypothetical protein n=1 Tax=Streptomyces sp. AC627_RSS907 TaxID=2823684 RepID=UPI001C2232EC|nr:hypothetical protein [Streptomyces sp. AC627_RSS907]